MLTLRLKSALVGSPIEGVAKRLRGIAKVIRPHLETAEIALEEERLLLIMDRLLSPSSNVLDIGCHIGSFLSLAISLAPSGRHAAIEASPRKVSLLRQKFPAADIRHAAVTSKSGTVVFEESLTHSGFSKIAGGAAARGQTTKYEVEAETLDDMEFGNFDLVKIDIEGAELDAFKGGLQFFTRNRCPVIFECGAENIAGLNRSGLFDHLTIVMKCDVFTFPDFLYNKGPLSSDEFRKCGIYPFRAFNFLALPRQL